MIGIRKQSRHRRIQLIRTDHPVSVLGIETGHHRVELSHTYKRVDTSRARRIFVKSFFEDFFAREIVPAVKVASCVCWYSAT